MPHTTTQKQPPQPPFGLFPWCEDPLVCAYYFHLLLVLFAGGGGGMCDKVSDSAYNKVYIFVKFSKLIIAITIKNVKILDIGRILVLSI